MNLYIHIGVSIAIISTTAFARPAQVPFDRVYTVAQVGNTTPVDKFPIDGPAPVLYLDLPAPWGQYSYGSSSWGLAAGTASLFTAASPGVFASDGEYWLTPTASTWNSFKSVGDWHANASYGWWDLVIIYGGGAPVTKAQGSATVNFSVNNSYPGDANLDGLVDTLDFNSLAFNFGSSGRSWVDGDFNFDATVDTTDFDSLAANFGTALSTRAAQGATVPEPSGLALGGVWAIMLFRLSNRGKERPIDCQRFRGHAIAAEFGNRSFSSTVA